MFAAFMFCLSPSCLPPNVLIHFVPMPPFDRRMYLRAAVCTWHLASNSLSSQMSSAALAKFATRHRRQRQLSTMKLVQIWNLWGILLPIYLASICLEVFWGRGIIAVIDVLASWLRHGRYLLSSIWPWKVWGEYSQSRKYSNAALWAILVTV